MSDPYISIVTVARNAEKTVKATLDAVQKAKTPATEYLFLDGQSTDRTMEYVRSYGDLVDVLISEKDEGQYHAIAKGLVMSRGEVQGWLNADDVIMPWTLRLVEKLFRQFPEVDWITGLPSFLDSEGNLVKVYTKPAAYPREFIANGWFDRMHGGFLQQESMFWRRSLYERANGLDLSLTLAADFALWTSFAKHAELVPIDVPLAAFRELPGEQRSSIQADKYDEEVMAIQASKHRPGRLWSAFAKRGKATAALARLMIGAQGQLITYDRFERKWKLTQRRRSISRFHISTLLDMRF